MQLTKEDDFKLATVTLTPMELSALSYVLRRYLEKKAPKDVAAGKMLEGEAESLSKLYLEFSNAWKYLEGDMR